MKVFAAEAHFTVTWARFRRSDFLPFVDCWAVKAI